MKISFTASLLLLLLTSSMPSKNNQAFGAIIRGQRNDHHRDLDDTQDIHHKDSKNDSTTTNLHVGATGVLPSLQTKKKQSRRMLSPKKGGKGDNDSHANVDVITPYRPACDAIMLHKDIDSKHILFMTNPNHSIQLLHHQVLNEGWCSATGCLGERWTAALSGEEIEKGYQVQFASTHLSTNYKLVCPFGLSPAISSTECVEPGNPVTSPVRLEGLSSNQGPFNIFQTGESGCDSYDVTITCTTDDEDLLKDIFKKAKSCKPRGTRLNSAENFLIQYQSDKLEVGIYVDGLDYELEMVDTQDNNPGACTPSACSGEKWSAYMTGVDITTEGDGGSNNNSKKYVLSVVKNHNWNHFQFMCPFFDQTPVLVDYYCASSDAVSITAGNFITRGPAVLDIDFINAGCADTTIEIHCLDPK